MKKTNLSRLRFWFHFKNDLGYISCLAIIFSFFGWLVENIARAVMVGTIDNRFHILPFIPVFGLISFAAYIFGNPDKLSFFGHTLFKKNTIANKVMSNILYFLVVYAMVFLGELAIGNAWEAVFGVKLWDYSSQPFHLTQYSSLYTTLGFGSGAYLLLRFGYWPFFRMLKAKVKPSSSGFFIWGYSLLLIDMLVMIIATAVSGEPPVYWSIDIKENGFPIVIAIEATIIQVFFIFLFLCLIANFKYLKPKKRVIEEKGDLTKFAILIPARNESAVIENTLKALQESSYDPEMYDIYVMVTEPDDPTIEICKKFNHVYCYTRTTTTLGKGWVLDEMIKIILKENRQYDCYMMIDADNIVDPMFLSKISDAYQLGYDIVVGNRQNKNPNSSATAGASGLTFSIINYFNGVKSAHDEPVLLTGTGYCIKTSIINAAGGWPFHSLTEDYELSEYARDNKLRTCYVNDAIFYDEQPIHLNDSIKQRTRWVLGFMNNNKVKHEKTLSGVSAFGMAITYIVFLAFNLSLAFIDVFKDQHDFSYLKILLIAFSVYYVLVFILSLVIFIFDRKMYRNITVLNAIKASLFHPVFLATYIISFFRTFKKGHEWETIPHSVNEDKK